jgi:hypothetical protein
MYFQPKLVSPLDWLFNYYMKVTRSFVDGFLYHLWISSAHMKLDLNLTGNSLFETTLNKCFIKGLFECSASFAGRFFENTVYGVRLATFSSYASRILGTPEPTTERISR